MSQFSPDKNPPKPRLTLRVGITGHRPNKLTGSDILRVAEELRGVMAAIDRMTAAIHRENAAFYSDAPPTGKPDTKERYRIRLISGFAEGADQMAVAAAPETWTVEAILPFPREEYRKDFVKSAGDGRDVTGDFDRSLKRAQAITELPAPPKADQRNQGYVMAGSFLLRQVDLLIAVWDGYEPKPGGTGAIVQEAWDGGIPVVWISTGADGKTQLIDRFEDETPIAADKPWNEETLKAKLDPILAAPSETEQGRRQSPRTGLERFYRENWRTECRMRLFDMLKRWIDGTRPVRRQLNWRNYDEAIRDFEQFSDGTLSKVSPLNERMLTVLAPRYVWADTLAVHFSHCYRSAYVIAYLLGALAVFIALVGIFVPQDYAHLKTVLVVVELAVIYWIVRVIRHGRRHHWHERWTDHRGVAESLRHGRFLAYVSEFGHSHQTTFASQPWTVWYIRATLREIGLPSAVLDAEYQRPIVKAMLEHEIEGQIKYHETTAASMGKLDHFLHRGASILHTVIPGVLLLFLVIYGIHLAFTSTQIANAIAQIAPNIDQWLLKAVDLGKLLVVLAAAGLPAIGAALAGIREQGDFEGAKDRSLRMTGELIELKKQYEAELHRQPRLDKTADMLIETARVMSEDLAAWHELYGRKRLNLPA